MNQATVRNTEITSRETVTAGAAAFRKNAMIENWAELKTISDSHDETHTVLDSEYQVTGFADIETIHSVLGHQDLRFRHKVSVDNDVKVTSTKNAGIVNVRIRANGACEGESPYSEIRVRGSEETMRQLAESILATLDGEQA
jgi:hypothetical protein